MLLNVTGVIVKGTQTLINDAFYAAWRRLTTAACVIGASTRSMESRVSTLTTAWQPAHSGVIARSGDNSADRLKLCCDEWVNILHDAEPCSVINDLHCHLTVRQPYRNTRQILAGLINVGLGLFSLTKWTCQMPKCLNPYLRKMF